MPVIDQRELNAEAVIRVAYDMAQAARTAPKANGYDRLSIIVVYGEELNALSDHMLKMLAEGKVGAHFERDAENLRASQACVIIGTATQPKSGGCGPCNMDFCPMKNGFKGTPICSFASHDLGLAVGSAVSIAADRRVDNRVMYSVAVAAMDMGWFSDYVRFAMGIPLSVSGKSIYYDRKRKQQ